MFSVQKAEHLFLVVICSSPPVAVSTCLDLVVLGERGVEVIDQITQLCCVQWITSDLESVQECIRKNVR